MTKLGMLMITLLVAFTLVALIFGVATQRPRRVDVICYGEDGKVVFYAEDAVVIKDSVSVTVYYDSKQRLITEGSCEWADHDLESPQSWNAGPGGGVRWASR